MALCTAVCISPLSLGLLEVTLERWQPAPWDMDSFSNLVVIYLLLFILSCYYEFSRRASHKLLQDS
ncbi:hypothetical protein [Marinomonas fungiae]|uniref:hypothetical protein n=1 Tax=Marinomonas fungiae TaxID=1137284 RepID=UPI0006E15F00|nr:hypothetical protein [Marinomonas fungiae]